MRYTKVGDIALVRIPEGEEQTEQEIAHAICERDTSVKVVLRQFGRYGEFRKQKVKVLIGDRTDTIHTEYGVKIHIDLQETYFSEREKTERQRLKNMVVPHEKILVLFAGVGVIPLMIAKEKDVDITAVEKNEKAFSLIKENIEMNSLEGLINPVLQDAYTFEGEEFDRVIVPQPYRHHSFEYVKSLVKVKGFLHYYTWVTTQQDIPAFPGFRTVETKTLFSYAPGVWKICIDMQKM